MKEEKKGTIYLEPRTKWDRALIDQVNVIYSFTAIIDILMETMDWTKAISYFSYNIQPLEHKGLAIFDDEYGKEYDGELGKL